MASHNAGETLQHSGSPVTIAALGRHFQVGCLYDYVNDVIIPAGGGSPPLQSENLVKVTSLEDTLKELADSIVLSVLSSSLKQSAFLQDPTPAPKQTVPSVDMLSFDHGQSSRFHHMNLCPHLQASVMSRLVGKLHGAAQYCFDESLDVAQAVKTLRVRFLTKRLGDPSAEMPETVSRGSATHVVTAIDYGVEAYAVFQRYLMEDEIKEDVEEELEWTLQKLATALTDRTELDTASVDHLRCRLYCDLHDSPRNCTAHEAFKLIKQLITTARLSPECAVPVTVSLRPLESVVSFRDLDEHVLNSCQQMLDGMMQAKSMVAGFLREDRQIKVFAHLRNSLRQFIDYLTRYVELLRGKLRRRVPAVRSNIGADHGAITEILNITADSPFHPLKLEKWLNAKRTEIETLRVITSLAGQNQERLLTVKTKLDLALYESTCKWVVVLILPSMEDHSDRTLASMKDYIDNNRLITGVESEERNEENPPCWFAVSNVKQELLKTVRRVFQHADCNSTSPDAERVKYLMTPLLPSPSPYRPTLALFQDGRMVSNDFHLPSPPTALRLKRMADVGGASQCVVLEWDCDQLAYVTHFTVQYKRHTVSGWWNSSTAGPVTLIQLDALTDPAGFQFRVASVSVIGRSEFGPVLEVPASTSVLVDSDELNNERHREWELRLNDMLRAEADRLDTLWQEKLIQERELHKQMRIAMEEKLVVVDTRIRELERQLARARFSQRQTSRSATSTAEENVAVWLNGQGRHSEEESADLHCSREAKEGVFVAFASEAKKFAKSYEQETNKLTAEHANSAPQSWSIRPVSGSFHRTESWKTIEYGLDRFAEKVKQIEQCRWKIAQFFLETEGNCKDHSEHREETVWPYWESRLVPVNEGRLAWNYNCGTCRKSCIKNLAHHQTFSDRPTYCQIDSCRCPKSQHEFQKSQWVLKTTTKKTTVTVAGKDGGKRAGNRLAFEEQKTEAEEELKTIKWKVLSLVNSMATEAKMTVADFAQFLKNHMESEKDPGYASRIATIDALFPISATAGSSHPYAVHL